MYIGNVGMQMNVIRQKAKDNFYDVVNRKGGKVIGEYVNVTTKLDVQCGTCIHTWKGLPSSIKSGTWCPLCAMDRIIDAEKGFYDVVNQRGGIVIGKYINTATKIEIQCGVCYGIWKPAPSCIKSGKWCPFCVGHSPIKAMNDFYNAVQIKGGRVIGSYINNRTKLEIQCGTCYNVWSTSPDAVKCGKSWCPACVDHCPIKAMNKFYEVVNSRGGRVVGNYVNNRTKIEIQCGRCHHVWSATPDKIKANRWCPFCSQSKGELAITTFLKTYNIPFQPEYKLPEDTHPFDFLIFYNNTHFLVEFDGEQHFEYVRHFHRTEDSFKDRIKVDMFKNELAYKNGIPLLRISYLELEQVDEWLGHFLTNPTMIMYSNIELYQKTYESVQ